jgi:aryl-alcohol dehydrogenase-like predicted oxidoreductase
MPTNAPRWLSAFDASGREKIPCFGAKKQAAIAQLVEQIEAIAAGMGVESAQLALASLYARTAELGVACVPIPRTRKRARLEKNLAAALLRPGTEAMHALEPLAAAVRGVAV